MLDTFENWLVEITGASSVWWIEIFVIVFIALLLGYSVNKGFAVLERHALKTRSVWDDALVSATRQPAVWLVWVIGVNFAAGIVARVMESPWYDFVEPINRVAVLFLGALFLVNFIKRAEENLVDPSYLSDPYDITTVRAVGKLARVSVIITVVLIAMQMFGYSVGGVLAFGGIGGIAVGFAAKDLLANFFGGLMIYLDRPFSEGDWVRSPDKEIEGTVEDIGWRLTRIRTFDLRPLYIPNAIFNNISVENPSRMLNRRIYETIGVRYEDISVLNSIVSKVKDLLENHSDIDTTQTLMVNFNQFAASSLNFFIYTFTKTTNWVEYHKIKQDVLLKVAGIIESEGAEIAYPTSTLHFADAPQESALQQAESSGSGE